MYPTYMRRSTLFFHCPPSTFFVRFECALAFAHFLLPKYQTILLSFPYGSCPRLPVRCAPTGAPTSRAPCASTSCAPRRACSLRAATRSASRACARSARREGARSAALRSTRCCPQKRSEVSGPREVR